MVTTGFLSTWLTALYSEPRLFDIATEFVQVSTETVPGFFPGTDWNRMLPAAPIH